MDDQALTQLGDAIQSLPQQAKAVAGTIQKVRDANRYQKF